jgi:hypothetical protein
MLLVGIAVAQYDRVVVPYLDTEGNFYLNYTGRITEGEVALAFTCKEDSLNLDSLLNIYGSVSVMDSVVFYSFIEMRMND